MKYNVILLTILTCSPALAGHSSYHASHCSYISHYASTGCFGGWRARRAARLARKAARRASCGPHYHAATVYTEVVTECVPPPPPTCTDPPPPPTCTDPPPPPPTCTDPPPPEGASILLRPSYWQQMAEREVELMRRNRVTRHFFSASRLGVGFAGIGMHGRTCRPGRPMRLVAEAVSSDGVYWARYWR
jgi:hypothetical protein